MRQHHEPCAGVGGVRVSAVGSGGHGNRGARARFGLGEMVDCGGQPGWIGDDHTAGNVGMGGDEVRSSIGIGNVVLDPLQTADGAKPLCAQCVDDGEHIGARRCGAGLVEMRELLTREVGQTFVIGGAMVGAAGGVVG